MHVSNEIYTLCYQIIQGNDVFLMQPDCHNIMKINITVEKCINIVRILKFYLCYFMPYELSETKEFTSHNYNQCKNANSRPNLLFYT